MEKINGFQSKRVYIYILYMYVKDRIKKKIPATIEDLTSKIYVYKLNAG